MGTPLPRESFSFPTRNYPYRYPSPRDPRAEGAQSEAAPELPLAAGKLHRFVMGLDPEEGGPRLMTDPESLGDPFAALLLGRGVFPLTLRGLLAALDAHNGDPDGLPEQKCFLAADGGQIPWSEASARVNRLFRFVLARGRGGDVRLLISASTVLDSTTQFIQVAAWDAERMWFNFYERRGGSWIWAGNGRHALEPATRGHGPFDSHVNGSLVMKELRQPWSNWHSQNASISEAVLAPDDPLRAEPLFQGRAGAEELETAVVRPAIARWNRARLAQAIATGDALTDVPFFLRQVLETTTVNLTSSDAVSRQVTDGGDLVLPTTFFMNVEALLDQIGLAPQVAPVRVPGVLYRESLRRYEFVLTDGTFTQEGDTFFAFLVPEPAFEDLNVLDLLLRERIITPKFAASLLMMDFPNPLFSRRRKRLMAYVPEHARLLSGGGGKARSDLADQFVAAVEAAAPASAPDSVEREFLSHWALAEGEWNAAFTARIEAYFARLRERAGTAEGFDGWVRLAESRRREFRKRPLAEFPLTLPTTNIPRDAPTLVMRADGSVAPLA